jgi:hypothetical protein
MTQVYWHDKHTIKGVGFFGYWCFEVAAFVRKLGINDEPFADNPYYPRDLVKASTATES